MPRTLAHPATLLDSPRGEPMIELAPGDIFEVLELSGGRAWGVAPEAKLVGYIDAAALESARS